MSGASSSLRTDEPSTPRLPDPSVVVATARRTVAAPLQFVGFWVAVALPFLYLPLVHDGFQDGEATVFLTLLVLNLLGLVLGRSYRRN